MAELDLFACSWLRQPGTPLIMLAPPPARGALVPPALPNGEPLQWHRRSTRLCRPRH